MVVKEQGLVATVFDDRTLAPLTGHLAIGHTRYSTTGSSTWRNAQPVWRSVGDTEDTNQFALGHNGNLVNTEALADEAGMFPARSRATATSSPSCSRTRDREATRRAQRRSRPRACADGGAADAPRRVLVRAGRRGPRDRRARSARLPAAVSRQARERLGARVGDARRSTSSAPTSCASSIPARWSSSTPPATGRCGRSPTPRSRRRCACSSSSTSPAPTAGCTAGACTRPGHAWASSSPSRRRSRPTW